MYSPPRSDFELTPRFIAAVIGFGSLFWLAFYGCIRAALVILPQIADALGL